MTLFGTAEANATVEVFDGSNDLGGTTVGADGHWAFTTAAMPDGTHPFAARATDAAGNVSSASAAFPVVIDTIAPNAPATTDFSPDTGILGDGLTNSPTPTLAGTAEPGSVVEVSDGQMANVKTMVVAAK